LTKRERKYVDFRHYAVLSVTCSRSKRPRECMKYAFKAVAVSPKFAVQEAVKMRRNKKNGFVQ